MLSPEKTRTRPSPSAVAVGYQRPTLMFGAAAQVLLLALKMDVSAIPTSATWCPPATNVRPSASSTWPEQKVFTEYGTGVKFPVAGFQIRCEFGPAAKPSQARTFPVGSSDMWTATSGQATGVDHCPTCAGSGGGFGFPFDGTTSIAASSGSSADP